MAYDNYDRFTKDELQAAVELLGHRRNGRRCVSATNMWLALTHVSTAAEKMWNHYRAPRHSELEELQVNCLLHGIPLSVQSSSRWFGAFNKARLNLNSYAKQPMTKDEVPDHLPEFL